MNPDVVHAIARLRGGGARAGAGRSGVRSPRRRDRLGDLARRASRRGRCRHVAWLPPRPLAVLRPARRGGLPRTPAVRWWWGRGEVLGLFERDGGGVRAAEEDPHL